MKIIVKAACISALLVTSAANADDDNNHFPSLKAPDLKTALCNLQSYNKKLSDITSKTQLTTVDMVKVHELTYTLENAILRMQKDLINIAANLEEVHLASERLDQKAIAEFGSQYFKDTQILLGNNECDAL